MNGCRQRHAAPRRPVTPAWYKQDLSQVPAGKSLYDITTDLRPAWSRGAVQNHLGAFGFSGDTVLRRAGSLSGGEQARMALSMMILEGANLLVFDEPTNHLDVESIEALETALDEYEGPCARHHDRALLEALATRVGAAPPAYHGLPGRFEEGRGEQGAEHSAAVAAAEQEAARRVQERQDPAWREPPSRRGDFPAAREAVAQARRPWRLRAVAAPARTRDPELTRPRRARRSSVLGKELEVARTAFETAFAEWERASAELDRVESLRQ
jgi:ATP-binding cassette subfamily F protein 3